jgi:hypothetical protein
LRGVTGKGATVAHWRTETHWYRPVRLTDAHRFAADMERGWRAVGALPPVKSVYDAVLADWYQPTRDWLDAVR